MTKEEAIEFGNMWLQVNEDSPNSSTYEFFQIAIKALEQEPRWIPITERLPASYEDVLVTNGVGTYVGWINSTGERWRVGFQNEYFIDEMVAWMPLPEPYEPQESEET